MTMFSSRAPFVTRGYDDELNVELYDRQQTNPTNPILLDIRANWLDGKSWSKLLDTFDYVRYAAGHYVTKEVVRVTDDSQLDHARRVLARLAELEGVSS